MSDIAVRVDNLSKQNGVSSSRQVLAALNRTTRAVEALPADCDNVKYIRHRRKRENRSLPSALIQLTWRPTTGPRDVCDVDLQHASQSQLLRWQAQESNADAVDALSTLEDLSSESKQADKLRHLIVPMMRKGAKAGRPAG